MLTEFMRFAIFKSSNNGDKRMTILEKYDDRAVECFKAWAVELVKVYGAKWSAVGPLVLRFKKAVDARDAAAFGDAIEAMENVERRVIAA